MTPTELRTIREGDTQMTEHFVRNGTNGRILRVTKITRHGRGEIFNVEGHRWVKSRQSFTKSVGSWVFGSLTPVEWGYTHPGGERIWLADQRPASREAIFAKYGVGL